jgi:conjugative transfer signal peptidase TraF
MRLRRSFSPQPSLVISNYHRLINRLSAGVLIGFLILFISDWLGLRINTSKSVDLGLYWVINKGPHKGDFVSFCPVDDALTRMAYERGYIKFGNCPGHYQRLLKIVVGETGDKICIQERGVTVNGALLPNSAVLSQDGFGQSLRPFSTNPFVLNTGELLVMTQHNPMSFDSRYFGPIRLNQISAVVKPIWTWR